VSVLYGGQDAFGQPLCDTWEFDGLAWRQIETARAPQTGLSAGGGLYEHAMVCDPVEGRILLFGGTDGAYDCGNTWAFDGRDWTQLPAAGSPYPRHGHALVYDAASEQVMLYGGEHTSPLADTFLWTGDRWQLMGAYATRPPARYGHALCYAPQTGQAILYGGRGAMDSPLGDTWSLDQSGWALLVPAPHAFFTTLPLVTR
jgi:hypothetical protein